MLSSLELKRSASTLGLLGVLLMSLLSSLGAHAAAASSGTMTFGVLDPRISYRIPSYNTLAVQDADLGMLLSTGASCVRTDIGYAPWLAPTNPATISLVTSVVGQIRSADKCLIVADAGSESYRTTPIPWAAFQTAWIQRVSTLAALYKPDYYIVIKEPRWYGPMISDASTNPLVAEPSQWITLTQELIASVQAVSPGTKIGVSADAGSLDDPKYSALYDGFLQGVSALPGLSFMGFDVYGPSDETATLTYLSDYGSGGKDVWVSETWSTANGSALNGNPADDGTWMSGDIYPFAASIHAAFLIPFYTDDFSSYAWDTNPTDIVAQLQHENTGVWRLPVLGARIRDRAYWRSRVPVLRGSVGGDVIRSRRCHAAKDDHRGRLTSRRRDEASRGSLARSSFVQPTIFRPCRAIDSACD